MYHNVNYLFRNSQKYFLSFNYCAIVQNVIHRWSAKLNQGKAGEAIIADWLVSRGHTVERVAELGDQLTGIDLRVTSPHGKAYTVEVKACSRGDQTGNAFIETVRNVQADRPGWIHTCEADWLFYLLTQSQTVYCFRTPRLRYELPVFELYPLRKVRNLNYHAAGHCVPLDVFRNCAEWWGYIG